MIKGYSIMEPIPIFQFLSGALFPHSDCARIMIRFYAGLEWLLLLWRTADRGRTSLFSAYFMLRLVIRMMMFDAGPSLHSDLSFSSKFAGSHFLNAQGVCFF